MLAYFVKYIHGSVEVKVIKTEQVLVLPPYCTKFLVKSANNLDDRARWMFLSNK
jgi:hypothetical protein